MSAISSTLLVSCLSAAYLLYSWEVLKVKKMIIPKRLYIFLFIVLVIILSVNYLYVSRFLGLVLLIIILTMFNMLIYNNPLKISFLTVIISETIAILGELLCAFLFFSANALFKLSLDINISSTSIVNLFVPIFSILLIKMPLIQKLKNKILVNDNKLENHQIIFPIIVLMISINILLAAVYIRIDGIILLIVNCFLMLVYFVIIISALRDKNKFIEVKEENRDLVVHLDEYEDILVTQRRRNHESKTELIVVRNLFKQNEYQRAMDCLDEIIGTKEELDESFYEMCQKMPSGIQGIVYQKLLVADPSIKIYIEVSPEIKKSKLDKKMHSDVFLDACQIIGVFLGNSLEEVDEIADKNNKVISVQLYIEKKKILVVQIGNTYRRGTDFSKIGEAGYTTKGGEHGQGLTLVRELEEKHPSIEHETIVSGKILFQKLKIKGLKL